MNGHCVPSAAATSRGFTLVETLIALAIVALVTTFAVPQYTAYIARSRLLDGFVKLSDYRSQMEQYFLDRRTYLDDAGGCGVAPLATATADAFTVTCTATATTFIYTAVGIASKGLNSFRFTIDETGARSTLSVPPGWSRTPDCWTFRQDGGCA